MPSGKPRTVYLLTAITLAGAAAHAASSGSELTPIDQIPRLPMFDRSVDYRQSLAGGVLAPDRIELDSGSVRTGQLEPALLETLGRQFTVIEQEEHRSRQQHWSYLRALAAKNNDSMHYYIIQHIYHHLQLSGWFKVHEWALDDLRIRVFLVRATETETPHVWLLHVVPQPLPEGKVSYVKSEGLALTRTGKRGVRWNVSRNTITIGGPAAADSTAD